MSKVKTILVILLIILLGIVNVYLSLLNTKMDFRIMNSLQEHREELESNSVMEDWIYDELDKGTWWYEGHTLKDPVTR